jgi:DNA primase
MITTGLDAHRKMGVDDIALVRAATSLVELFEEVTAVRRHGRTSMARCPFHDEKTPSCSLDDTKGLYHCFGCGAAGDAIEFVKRTRQLTFPEAVGFLASRAGIMLAVGDDADRENRERRRALQDTLSAAFGWYQHQLFGSPTGEIARTYLESRGWSQGVAEQFGLGWAPPGAGVARAAGLNLDNATAAGLLVKASDGRRRDMMRGRLVFPIFDHSGLPVALAGRLIDGDGPKYINFAETELYQKRKILYGLNWAKTQIVATDTVVVCEGYTDVIALHLAGITNAVATCGIALTEEHVSVLARFGRRLVIAYDADTAGQGALDHMHRWERANDMELSVARFPDGRDPADVAAFAGGAALSDAIAAATPLLGWRLDRLFVSSDLSHPEGRVSAARSAATIVAEHPSSMLRDQYVDVIANQCRIPPDQVRRLIHPQAPPARIVRTDAEAPRGLEYQALRLAVCRPDLVAGWISPDLFADQRCRQAVAALESFDDLADVIAGTSDSIGQLVARCSFDPATLAESDEVRSLMAVAAGRRALSMLAAAIRVDGDRAGASAQVGELRRLVDGAAAGAGRDATDHLLTWLAANLPPSPPAWLVAPPVGQAVEDALGDPEDWL